MKRSLWIPIACLALSSLPGCATRWTGADYYTAVAADPGPDHQLAGEALVQQKQTLRRVHRDLKSVWSTAESLRRHRDFEGITALEGFVHPFLSEQVEPLLLDGPSGHAELRVLQANVRFAQAAVLIELRDSARLADVRRRIERDFDANASMLVEYPPGHETTLEHALRDLERGRGLL